MARNRTAKKPPAEHLPPKALEFETLNDQQRAAWDTIRQNDVSFLLGPAGTGKTFIATAYAIQSLLAKQYEKIVISRPVVEAGEKLGFLPGDFNEKVDPYMQPIYDALDQLVGVQGTTRERVTQRVQVAPLAFMRGRTFRSVVCLLDEAQNATLPQLKMFLTRFGQGSKIIVTGDPRQSDIGNKSGLNYVSSRLQNVEGIGVIEFDKEAIVRHPLVGKILDRLEG